MSRLILYKTERNEAEHQAEMDIFFQAAYEGSVEKQDELINGIYKSQISVEHDVYPRVKDNPRYALSDEAKDLFLLYCDGIYYEFYLDKPLTKYRAIQYFEKMIEIDPTYKNKITVLGLIELCTIFTDGKNVVTLRNETRALQLVQKLQSYRKDPKVAELSLKIYQYMTMSTGSITASFINTQIISFFQQEIDLPQFFVLAYTFYKTPGHASTNPAFAETILKKLKESVIKYDCAYAFKEYLLTVKPESLQHPSN